MFFIKIIEFTGNIISIKLTNQQFDANINIFLQIKS
jgi:hypothetical protein